MSPYGARPPHWARTSSWKNGPRGDSTLKAVRNELLYAMRLHGATYAELGRRFDLSSTRVGQLVRRTAVAPLEDGPRFNYELMQRLARGGSSSGPERPVVDREVPGSNPGRRAMPRRTLKSWLRLPKILGGP